MRATKSTSCAPRSCLAGAVRRRDDELDRTLPSPSARSRNRRRRAARERAEGRDRRVRPGGRGRAGREAPSGVASASSLIRVSERLLEKQAVDREQEVVDAVERQLETRCDSAEHEPSDASEPGARWKLDRCPVGGRRSSSRAPVRACRGVVAIGMDREDAIEQRDLEDALDVRVGADDTDGAAASDAAASRPRAARRASWSR